MRDLLSRIRNNGILLELVDGELKLFASNTSVDKTLLQEIREHKGQLVEFLQNSHTDSSEETVHIAAVGQQPDYALSSSQRRLWILSQFDAGNVAYNMPGVYVFNGGLNTEALSKAFDTLIERHESLRTVFRMNEAGEARQIIQTTAEAGFSIGQYDLRSQANLPIAVQQLVQQQFATPFNLAEGPLLRAALIQTADEQWVFTYMMHHIISDGWSMGVLINELLILYNHYSNGLPNPLPPLRIHYKDYAAWQQEQLSGEALQQHASYWMQQLGGELPVLDLPGDKPRPAAKTYNGGRVAVLVNPLIAQQLKALCQEQGGTLFMGLVAAINALLYKYTGQHDIVLGTQIAGRVHQDLENQIGFYLNTLALRTRFNDNDNFKDLLANAKKVTLGAYQHQVYPFDELVDALSLQRDPSRNPLFDVSVVLQNADAGNTAGQEQQSMGDLSVSAYDGQQAISSLFDLAFDFTETPGGLQTILVYNSDIYGEAAMNSLLQHFQQLLQGLVAQPNQPLRQLEYLTAAEKTQLLEGFNPPPSEYPRAASIAALFAQQVIATPQAMAVIAPDGQLNYTELNEKAERLAHYLQTQAGVATGDKVGILLERSTLLPVAILAILKAGAVYVPIDTEHPKGRQAYIAHDTSIKALITQTDYLFEADYFTGHLVALDVQLDAMELPIAPLANTAGADSAAYIMYTSGSTGTPKGVMVPQRAVVRLVKNTNFVSLTGKEVLLSTGAVSFDATTFEYWGMLLNGGTLVLCSRDTLLDEAKLTAAIQQYGVNIMWFTAGWLHQLIDKAPEVFTGLQTILAGGDKLSPSHIAQLRQRYPDLAIINGYGPTENTTFSLTYHIEEVTDNIPIGRPISNSTAYVLGPALQLLPVGAVGEICVGGDGLAIGYINQPELTAEKFIDNPWMPGQKMYRTGDMGRWLPDGTLSFMGRRDEQVKIRGYRIELGEIEALLQSHPAVESTIVLARPNPDGEKEIVAYVVSPEALTANALAAYLGMHLPGYMVPTHFVQLGALPLNANGKVDKHQLPDPAGSLLRSGVEYVAPRTETEIQLVAIWQEILGRENIGVKDNFFDLGGHSLRATRLAAQLHKVFNARIELKDLFAQPVLEDQARLIDQAQQSAFVAIEPVPTQASYVLSSSQRRLWVLSQFEEGSVAYNIPGVYVFEGPLNIDALHYAFDALMERHESLRTVFGQNEEGEVRQFVLPANQTGFHIQVVDWRGQENIAEQLHSAIAAAGAQPFDLARGPLIRATLHQVDDNHSVFSYCLHHIISDGWSMGILINELFHFYQARHSGQAPALAPLRIQYKDYAAWQQQQLSGESLLRHKAYWLQQLGGELPVLELPGDSIRPAIKTYNGGSVAKVIGTQACQGIKALSQQKGATLFMGLLAAVNALLYRYTDQEDIVIGSPIAGREHADLHDQIGFYLNTLALRTRFSGNDSYQYLLERVRAITMDAYEHQIYPFDELVDELNLQRDMSRSALFDVMVVLQNNEMGMTADAAPVAAEGNDAVQATPNQWGASPYGGGEAPVSKFDITFNFTEAGDALQTVVEFNSDIYSQATIERMVNHLEQLMQAVVLQPSAAIGQLNYLATTERAQLLTGFNQTEAAPPPYETLVQWFEAQVAATPNNVAVVFGDTNLSYDTLNRQANRLAHCLHQQYQLQPDALVGICLQRSHWLMVAIMGILKSGGAYVPIDPDYPQERIDYLKKDSGCELVIDDAWIASFAADASYSDENPAPSAQAQHLAYVIYTSGSTGMPKGVMIEHRNIVNYTHWFVERYGIRPGESTLLVSSITFDGVLTSVYGALLTGSAIHVLPKELPQSPLALATYIHDQQITFIKITPPPLKLMVADEASFTIFKQAKHLRLILCGGEAMNRGDIAQIQQQAPHVTVVNHYGPTETTVGCLAAPVESTEGDIPVGCPIYNTQAYILDALQQPVPLGVLGEICVGGAGVARGYLNNPELTAAKYVPNPFRPGERMYRTGDVGRWLPDGKVLFLGRRDQQVKIRGYRIELGEVEAALQKHPAISAAVVMARADQGGENELAAYLVSADVLNTTDIRNYLKTQLPDYMVPTHYVQMDVLPLNTSGKVDRKALPDPSGLGLATGVEYIAPRNETEEKLQAIWGEVLGRDATSISVKDNFFDLGGHSLKATRLIARIYKALDVKLSLQEVFIKPVLENQAQLISMADKTQYQAIERLPAQPHYALSASQRRLWVLSQFEEGNLAYNMPGVYTLEGNIDQTALTAAFDALIARHESLRTVFREVENGEVRQFILLPEQTGFQITWHHLTGTPGQEAQVQQLIQANAATPFDLATGPLLRVSLFELDGGKWVLNYVMHHIISDGVSMEILLGEVLHLYAAFSSGHPDPASTLVPLRIQYKDFAAWQQQQLSGELLQQHQSYWLQQFEGELPILDLPGDYPRPAIKTYNGGAVNLFVNQELTNALRQLGQEQGATLFMGLLTLVNTLMYKYAHQRDIIIGTTIAGREHADLENQIGFFPNTLVLRSRFNDTDSFKDLLGHVKEITLGAYEHQVYPFDELVDNLHLRRDLSRNALFDVSVNLHNTALGGSDAAATPAPGNLQMGGYDTSTTASAKFDLAFDFTETAGGLLAGLVYNSDIFNHDTAVRMMAHLQQLLEAIVQQPQWPLQQLEYISEAERQQLTQTFNDTVVDYPAGKAVVTVFEEQVASTPDKIALEFEELALTYQQLNEEANRWGHYLRHTYQLQPNDIIGIELQQRSHWLIIAILGVLKAGAAYLPLDADYPEDRRRFMATDCNCKLIINEEVLATILAQKDQQPSDNPVTLTDADSLVYVMYTSGSTGQPKGVMIRNGGVVRLVKPMSYMGFSGNETLLSAGAISFDATTFEFWSMLLNGGRLVMCRRETLLDPQLLEAAIERHGVDTMWFTTGWLNQMVDVSATLFRHLRTVKVGGDRLSPVHIRNLKQQYPQLTIVNGYGPTENTGASCCYTIGETVTDNIPVGPPIDNSTAWVLDEQGHLVPVGVVGELCVGGAGLALGYLNQPELTAEKFVPNPYRPGERMYKTGDLVRWLPDGNIEFRGRKDGQVKIAGYRIEPGEVESVLQRHPQIDSAVVMAKPNKNGEKELVAYYVAAMPLTASDLRTYMGGLVPAYMVPGYFVQLEAMPLNPNGKVDRKLLPDPQELGLNSGIEYVAPTNETEERLVEIWKEILGREPIGIKDNFFDLGGHSLKVTQLISKINIAFGVGIGIETVFLEPTIESIAQRIVFIQTQNKQKEDMSDMQEIEI
jgi:amino acid adenylation domain-containing protein